MLRQWKIPLFLTANKRAILMRQTIFRTLSDQGNRISRDFFSEEASSQLDSYFSDNSSGSCGDGGGTAAAPSRNNGGRGTKKKRWYQRSQSRPIQVKRPDQQGNLPIWRSELNLYAGVQKERERLDHKRAAGAEEHEGHHSMQGRYSRADAGLMTGSAKKRGGWIFSSLRKKK